MVTSARRRARRAAHAAGRRAARRWYTGRVHDDEREWSDFDAPELVGDAPGLAARLAEACGRRRCTRFTLVGPAFDAAAADALAAALAAVDASLRLRAAVRPPLARRQLRELRRVGFVALELPGVTSWPAAPAHLELLVGCASEGLLLRHDLADTPADTVPTLVHLPPPGEADAAPDGPHARWHAAHGSGLLVRRRTPGGLRVVDSRRMAWCGRSSGARPRVLHLRGAFAAVHDACRRPRSLVDLRDDLPEFGGEAIDGAVAALLASQLIARLGGLHLALAVDEPAWYERDPIDARDPLTGVLPAASPVWEAALRDAPWSPRARRTPTRLAVLGPEDDE